MNRIIESDGDELEVSEEDYQRFIRDQERAEDAQQMCALKDVIVEAMNRFEGKIGDVVDAVRSLPPPVVTVPEFPPFPSIPEIEIPTPIFEAVMPKQKQVKELEVVNIRRDSGDKIIGCTIKVSYK
jgi:hypothetical protein